MAAIPRSSQPCAWMLLACLVCAIHSLEASSAYAGDGAERDHERLVILAPDRFHASLETFVTYKKGIRATELFSLERILESNDGYDDPEKIKRWLFSQWQHQGVGYVLLVGDAHLLPVRYMVLDRVTPAAFDYAFYPSDLYYSDLAKPDGTFDDWNANKNSFHERYFGEVRGEKNKSDPINFDAVDYRPEIAVGRWPVETDDQVVRLCRKSIAYEESVLSGGREGPIHAAFVSVGGWVDTRARMDRWVEWLGPNWDAKKLYYSDRSRRSTAIPNRDSVVRCLNDGVRLMIHAGHGQTDAWEQCISTRDLDALANSNALPVVVSAGCSTANFAPLPPYTPYEDTEGRAHPGTDAGEVFTQPPEPPSPWQRQFRPTGLGEQILVHNEGGAVAYIGCNTGSQPCGLTLVEGFVNALATDATPHLGECWSQAIQDYYDHENLEKLVPDEGWYPPSIFFQGMKFMCFGDPSLSLPR